MEAKNIIFLLALVLGIPVGVALCLAWRRLMDVLMVLMIWATCEPDTVGINFVSREFYRANTRGFEISLVDLCALTLMFAMLFKPKEFTFRWRLPMAGVTILYLIVGFVSWSMAGDPLPVPAEAAIVPYERFEVNLYPLFELSKIFRGLVVFLVVANFVRSEQSARVVLTGLALTVLYMGWLALSSRYLQGVNRVRATLGHSNSLATYMAMLGSYMYAMMLHRKSLMMSALFGFLTLLSTVAVILTISRGGLAALVLGIFINTLALLPSHVNLKNTALIAVGVLAAAAILGVAMDTLVNRFVKEQDASADLEYRGLYNKEAKLMAKERTWGVGLGNFSAWSWSRYAEQVDPDLPPGTPAHNNWYLTLGELGMPGLVVFSMLWLRYFALAIPLYFGRKTTLLQALGVASCTSIIVDHLQSCLQLGYRQTPMYFMMILFLGLTVASWRNRREESKAGLASAAVGAAGPLPRRA